MNHHFTPSFDSIRQPALEVSWSSIIDEFNFRFHSIYDHTTSKIHLDLDNYAIDGSTSTWRDIVLLDCILCIFLKRKVNAKGGSRRLFNQYVAIRESVCVVCSQAWVRQLSQPLNTNTNRFSSIIESIDVSFPSQVVLTEISQVWSSMDNLRAEFLHTTPKKSASKRHDIANHYFNLDVFRTKSLQHIALDVVNFIFREVSI